MGAKQNLERELSALDALENLLEYVKLDILRPEILDLDGFQAELIAYRAVQHDTLQVLIIDKAADTPAGGGEFNNTRDG